MPKFAPYPTIVFHVNEDGIGKEYVLTVVDNEEVIVVLLIEDVPL
jgi:hypothetical protein